MRRFRPDREGIVPDEHVVALWKCNDGGLQTDSAYSGVYDMLASGSGATVTSIPGLYGGLADGAISTSSGAYLHTSKAATVRPDTFFAGNRQGLSVSMWVQTPDAAAATAALFEYSLLPAPTDTEELMPLGIYRLANGKIRVQKDVSTSSLAWTLDFNNPVIASEAFHLALVEERWRTGSNTFSSTTHQYDLYINGRLVDTKYMPGSGVGQTASSALFVLGGSRRWSADASGDTAAFTAVKVNYDDVAVFDHALTPGKVRDIYRSGQQSWHDRRLFESGSAKTVARVLVENQDRQWVDLSSLYGKNWIRSAESRVSADDPVKTASFSLHRRMGETLDLSPLNESSILNYDATETFEAMLELRRRVLIEVATVPAEHRIQDCDYRAYFEGYVDDIEWGADSIEVACLDNMTILKDLFQLDPRAYDYLSENTLAETHMQTLIEDNVPTLLLGVSTLKFSFLGGYTPMIYTPASTGWFLRWDDTPSGNVDALITSVADQIGWDLRWKFYEPWQQDRLTFFEPPRDLELEIEHIGVNVDGDTELTTTIPHGLTAEQEITIDDTTNYNGTRVVKEVVRANRVVLEAAVAVPPDGATLIADLSDVSTLSNAGGVAFGNTTDGGGVGYIQNTGSAGNYLSASGYTPLRDDDAQNGLTALDANPSGAWNFQLTGEVLSDIADPDGNTIYFVIRPDLTNGTTQSGSLWARTNNNRIGFGYRDNAGTDVMYMMLDDGTTKYSEEVECTIGEWHVVGFRHNSSGISTMVDDGEWTTPVATGNISDLTAAMYFFENMNMKLGEIRWYDRDLSEGEQRAVLDYFKQKWDVGDGAGTPDDEIEGTLTYGPVFKFPDRLVKQYDPIRKGAADIRNACQVKFNRDNDSTATLTVSFPARSSGQSLIVEFNEDAADVVPYFQVGQTFSVASLFATDVPAYGDWEIGQISTSNDRAALISKDTGSGGRALDGSLVACTGTFHSTYLTFRVAAAYSTPSIDRYGYRPCAIYEQSSGNINQYGEARRLARAVVSDLAEPTIHTRMKVPCCPWVELHDIVGLVADKKGRWSSDLVAAVTGVNHHFDKEASYSEFELRNAAPTKGSIWAAKMQLSPTRPGSPSEFGASTDLDDLNIQISNVASGIRIFFRSFPYTGYGRSAMRLAETEVHASTTETFVVSQDTLMGTMSGNVGVFSVMPGGSPIIPGLPLWIRIRHRDVFGNLTLPSEALPFTPRANSQTDGGLAFMHIDGNWTPTYFAGTSANSGMWYAYPFNSTSSPGYTINARIHHRPQGLLPVVGQEASAASLSPITALSPSSLPFYYRMPYDGTVNITAYLTLKNYNVGTDNELGALARFGVLRLSSRSDDAFNASVPYFVHRGDYIADGVYHYQEGATTFSVQYVQDFTGVRFSTDVTAYSGDYVLPAVSLANETGIGPPDGSKDAFNRATPWVKYTIHQD